MRGITGKESFRTAEDILNYLWRERYTQEKSVILVANKVDLARSRVISTNAYRTHYKNTSAFQVEIQLRGRLINIKRYHTFTHRIFDRQTGRARVEELEPVGNRDKEHIVVLEENGKALAASRDCKYIETSSGIQHNVDELLVGVLKQIRLRATRDRKRQRRGSASSRLHGSRTSLSLNIAREILHKICLNDSKSKSCENLHVL
ncbi:hypothetical protein FOCC_FOCC006085 [Frankliniella occidentalis]|nr:hypothetical protein FOCC_FOCC006085 [Frankliniella occidentalis]